MVLWGEFTIKDYKFTAHYTDKWIIEVSKDNVSVFHEELRMLYEPVFGADVSDVANLNARIEEIIIEMGLE